MLLPGQIKVDGWASHLFRRIAKGGTVQPVADIPPCMVPPEPMVLSSEHRVELIYLCSLAWEPDRPLTREFDEGESLVAAVRFAHTQFVFGYPNDEVLNGHPLYAAGLRSYECQTFTGKRWSRQLERQNAVHRGHRKGTFSRDRHFIFPFQDSTFEWLADGYEVFVYRGSMDKVLAERAAQLNVV